MGQKAEELANDWDIQDSGLFVVKESDEGH